MYEDADKQRPVVGTDAQAADYRPPFIRDYGRITHSASFRRQQGKTQVFPGHESDFFRNRLTHSLEVSQIAEGIADRLNHEYGDKMTGGPIDGRLCATAGLVHDIGHPPFGHNGERALDEKMKKFGGFEGNAQTLRILARLEKKERYPKPIDGDDRAGMNLCYRTLGAVLKYDKPIPEARGSKEDIAKGYYLSEQFVVDDIKEHMLRGTQCPKQGDFKTLECAIMDLADDIAYSVYDLEDSLKAGFLTPARILASDESVLAPVAAKVEKALKKSFSSGEVLSTLVDIFGAIVPKFEESDGDEVLLVIEAMKRSRKLSADAYRRTKLSSSLVHEFIKGVRFEYNERCPALSKVWFDEDTHRKVEVLKRYTYNAIISSPRVKLGEYRGTQLVSDIFDALWDKERDSHMLMPDDVRYRYLEYKGNESKQARTVCDFIAGMTDRYAVEFWARMNSDAAESMFKDV
ncbi:dNTP triphosphohydrolase [Agrobacterium rhizogenes]|nr:dNTP triphosphohydrolase [Rhizobium rhizogenes]